MQLALTYYTTGTKERGYQLNLPVDLETCVAPAIIQAELSLS